MKDVRWVLIVVAKKVAKKVATKVAKKANSSDF